VTTLGKHSRAMSATAVLLGGVLTLGACGMSDADAEAGGKAEKAKAEAQGKTSSQAHIKLASKNGSEGASINDGANVAVSKGKLTDVKLISVQAGTAVDGTTSADGKTWKPRVQLERATQYKITAKAKGQRRPQGL
jgi:hypothetical protein